MNKDKGNHVRQSGRAGVRLPRQLISAHLRRVNVHTRARGQVLPLYAIAMMAIVLMVGLAVDGGLLYGGSRRAQNVADAGALAASRQMLAAYEAMANVNSIEQDGSAEDERAILDAIYQVATANKLPPEALRGYFVDAARNPIGEVIGKNERVPFQEGARGVIVRTEIEVGTVFMAVINYSSVRVSASAIGFMAPAIDFDPNVGLRPGLLPLAFNLSHIEALTRRTFSGVGGVDGPEGYILLDGVMTPPDKGEWDWIDFNGVGDAQPQGIVEAWKECGYHPALRVGSGKEEDPFQWPRYCARGAWENQEGTTGPTQYWWKRPGDPSDSAEYAPTLRWGPDETTGWWLKAFRRRPYTSCEDMHSYLGGLEGTSRPILIFDDTTQSGGWTWLHSYYVGLFAFRSVEVNCRVPPGFDTTWRVSGSFQYVAAPGSTGSVYPPNPRNPWDLWGASFHLAYLQP